MRNSRDVGVIDASLLKDELRNFSRPVPTLIPPNHTLPGAAVWEGWECASPGLATVVGRREEPLMECCGSSKLFSLQQLGSRYPHLKKSLECVWQVAR